MFDVFANGIRVLHNYDIFSAAGGKQYRAVVPEFGAIADGNGTLALKFSNGTASNPKVSGIEVRQSIVLAVPSRSGGDGFSGGAFYPPVASLVSKKVDSSKVIMPAPDAVYQTELFGDFIYTKGGLTPGQTYLIRLHESENYWTASGQRKFNVSANGETKLVDYDIIGTTGGQNIAVAPEFYATADKNGQIELQFTTGSANLPKVDGVEIFR
uniref:malectin domain-containing carbohydrate-binding protein n=1 Tax=Burkholderia arboris TaxID=488730 RepID=UPI003BEEC776